MASALEKLYKSGKIPWACVKLESHSADAPEMVKLGMEKVRQEDLTVTFGLLEGEEIYYCPYERSHQVVKNRYAQHLQKCQRNYLKALEKGKGVTKVEICPYLPSMHHVAECYFTRHLELCPNKQQANDQFDTIKSVMADERRCQVSGNNDSGYCHQFVSRDFSISDTSQKLENNRGCVDVPVETLTSGGNELAYGASGEQSTTVEGYIDAGDVEWSDDGVEGYDPCRGLEQKFFYRNPSGLSKSERRKFQASQALKFPQYVREQELKQLEEDGKKVVDKTAFYYDNIDRITRLRNTNSRFLNTTEVRAGDARGSQVNIGGTPRRQ